MDERSLIDNIAASLGVLPGARQRWRSRGHVPHRWRLPILTEAGRRGLSINPALFDDYRRLRRAPTARRARQPEAVSA